ncbi:translocation and assembly module TamB [Azospirillaceae bacterium]
MRGSFREPRLSGTMAVRRAELRLPDQLPPQVFDLHVRDITPVSAADADGIPLPRRKPRPPAGGARSVSPPVAVPMIGAMPALGPDGLILALTISGRNQIFVRGRGVDAEFGCELTVGGTAERPTLKGALAMQRGQLDLLGKPFQFKRGTIIFSGSADPDPALDLLAEAHATGLTAQAVVTGSARAPKLVLTSVPVLPPDEVLARVLFDKPTAQLTPLEAVQLADSAVQLVGLGGSAGVVERVRRSLGVDRLGFTGGSPGGAPGRQSNAFEAGRYLSDQVYVGVEQGVSGDTASRAKVEIGLTDTLQAEAGIGIDAQPRVGLKFEWDY